LRLYTTAVYKHMNAPLRDDTRYHRGAACPLPVATYFANQAGASSPSLTQTEK
jgi:hypothetical protein